MDVKDFDYFLPEELIAQDPLEDRSASRLLVLNKDTGRVEHRFFRDIVDYLRAGDCLVINDTRVIPARLLGFKEETNAHVEVFLLKRLDKASWECLVRPGRKLKKGARVDFGDGLLKAVVSEELDESRRIVKFLYDGIFEEILGELGEMPLPPYIKHKLKDKDRYQTVYATHEGSVAAPTAGLHFTDELLNEIEEKGVKIAKVTLHVGLGTFRSVKAERLEDHHMHSEYYEVGEKAASLVNSTLENGGRVFAVGTTSVRTLESQAMINPEFFRLDESLSSIQLFQGLAAKVTREGKRVFKYRLEPGAGYTDIFIYPGYEWKLTECLITNFHLPKSTLIMLVSALAGRRNIMNAYDEAIKNRYRFYSFGDAMLIVS